MTNKLRKNYYTSEFLGVFLLIVGILALFNAFYYSDISIIFWFCYLSIPLAGIGLLIKNYSMIKSQLYILAIPDLIWCIDFFYHLIMGKSLLGITDYFFYPGAILPKLVTLQHIIAIPIIFYALILVKNKNEDSWKISLFQLTAVFLLTRIFTSQIFNVNCVYHICGDLPINLGMAYPILWFSGTFFMVYLSRSIFIRFHSIFRRLFYKIKI